MSRKRSKKKNAPWLDRIAEAKKRGKFTVADKREASQWPRCAVGEHAGSHAWLYDLWGPVDETLRHLGIEFEEVVASDAIDSAETTLFEINDRVMELKRERKG